jgi:hypothetical protein
MAFGAPIFVAVTLLFALVAYLGAALEAWSEKSSRRRSGHREPANGFHIVTTVSRVPPAEFEKENASQIEEHREVRWPEADRVLELLYGVTRARRVVWSPRGGCPMRARRLA